MISDDVEERLVALLGDPGTCPHGNPIPGSAMPVDESAQRPLADVRARRDGPAGADQRGRRARHGVARLPRRHGFIPGATAEVTSRGPDGTMLLAVGDATVAFGPDLSRRLYVAVV